MPSRLVPVLVPLLLQTLVCPIAAFFLPHIQGSPIRRLLVPDFFNMAMSPASKMQEQPSKNASAPLYITIGPPCSGKTTWLKKKTGEEALVDICLDDQPNVYIEIPFSLFCMSAAEMKAAELPSAHRYLLQRSYFQKGTVQERILSDDQQELRLVLQRVSGRISSGDFETSLRSLHTSSNHQESQQNNNEVALIALLESVEHLMSDRSELPELPDTVNLFIVEALFQKGAQQNMTGIERATNLLRTTPKNVPVSWGNTNTKPRDYMTALEIAEEQGRPVNFCVYGGNDNISSSRLFDLPKLDFRELVDRNLQRLIQTGQYIPCKVIEGLSGRVEQIVADAASNFKTKSPNKFDLDRQLAQLAKFDLQDDRTVKNRVKKNLRNGRGWDQSWNSNRGGPRRDNQYRPSRGRGRGPPRHLQERPSADSQYRSSKNDGHNQYRAHNSTKPDGFRRNDKGFTSRDSGGAKNNRRGNSNRYHDGDKQRDTQGRGYQKQSRELDLSSGDRSPYKRQRGVNGDNSSRSLPHQQPDSPLKRKNHRN